MLKKCKPLGSWTHCYVWGKTPVIYIELYIHLRLVVIYINSKTEYIIVSFNITFYHRTIPSLLNYLRALVCGYLACHTFILGENIEFSLLYEHPFTIREERRLKVFENTVLRRIFGPKRDEVTGEWRKLHNEEP